MLAKTKQGFTRGVHLLIYEAARMDDGVFEGFAVNEVLLSLALPDEDVPISQLIERVVLISAAHAGDEDHFLHACLLGCIDLCFLSQPVYLHSTAPLLKAEKHSPHLYG